MHDTHTTHESMFTSNLEKRVVFFFVAMGVAAITYGIFFIFDFLPEKPGSQPDEVAQTETVTEEPSAPEEVPAATLSVEPLPLRIIFDALDKEVEVLNPTGTSVAELDTALLSGAVRHPDSADFENTGTIFILGHSSYLPTVHNKNFQAFNGIQKLVWGDTIRLQSADMEYVYSVDRVYEAKATEAEVPMQYTEAKLVLATCDSFGTKDDRFMVEATLISKKPL